MKTIMCYRILMEEARFSFICIVWVFHYVCSFLEANLLWSDNRSRNFKWLVRTENKQ